MLVKLSEEQIKQDARVAFFEAVEKINPIKLSDELNEVYLRGGQDIDFSSIAAFEKEIELLKLQFARGDQI
jgi:hypothetical protein